MTRRDLDDEIDDEFEHELSWNLMFLAVLTVVNAAVISICL